MADGQVVGLVSPDGLRKFLRRVLRLLVYYLAPLPLVIMQKVGIFTEDRTFMKHHPVPAGPRRVSNGCLRYFRGTGN